MGKVLIPGVAGTSRIIMVMKMAPVSLTQFPGPGEYQEQDFCNFCPIFTVLSLLSHPTEDLGSRVFVRRR